MLLSQFEGKIFLNLDFNSINNEKNNGIGLAISTS